MTKTKIKRLNLSLLDNSEVSMFKSLCRMQGIALPEDFDEKFRVGEDNIIPDFPYIVFDDIGEVKLQEEPDEDFVWLNGLDGFIYIVEKFQDQEFIIAELVHARNFENLYIKFLEEADEDFDYDEPESWETEDEDDEECECECPECCQLEEDQMFIRVSPPVKLAFNKVEAIRELVENLELAGFEAREAVRDTDLFIAIYEDKTYETMESSRTYLGLDIPEA